MRECVLSGGCEDRECVSPMRLFGPVLMSDLSLRTRDMFVLGVAALIEPSVRVTELTRTCIRY